MEVEIYGEGMETDLRENRFYGRSRVRVLISTSVFPHEAETRPVIGWRKGTEFVSYGMGAYILKVWRGKRGKEREVKSFANRSVPRVCF